MTAPPTCPRRIAFVSNNAWSVYNYRLEVIRSLLQSHYEILVIAPHDAYAPLLIQEGCRFIPVSFNNKSAHPLRDLSLYAHLRRLYKNHRPDFIFHYVTKPNIYGTLAASSVGIPSVAVITGLGYAFARRNLLYWVVRLLYRLSLSKAGNVWFLNADDARFFVAHHIVNEQKVQVLPGEGVDTRYFSPVPPPQVLDAEQPFTFLMSARLLRSKGIGIYAEAARLLKEKHYPVRCLLIGYYEREHPDAIASEDLQRWIAGGYIQYLGFENQVRSRLQEADCFVFPSYYNEGVPRSLLEAASMQLPIITTRNKGCREVVIDQETGFLCNNHDARDLADQMEKIISLPARERRQMGEKGRRLVQEKFDVLRVIATYKDTLDKAFALPRSSG